jgi:cell division transport system permease protein
VSLALVGFVLRRVRKHLQQLLWIHILTSGTVAAALVVFGAFILIEINVAHLLKGWGEQIQITAYLDKNVDPSITQALLERIEAMPQVERIRHTTQEQAWRDFQIALGAQSGLLEGLPRNVLPASVEVYVKASHRDSPSLERFAQQLRHESTISDIDYPQQWVERLGLIALAVGWARWIFGGILFLATFFIVGSTIKLAMLARKDEIQIMQLVGASEALIQAPFVLEGMILGALGGTISVCLLWAAYVLLRNEIASFSGFLAPIGQVQFFDLNNIALLLTTGCLWGGVAGVVSLRRALKTWNSSRGER